MAIYHLSAKIIGRSSGRSAVASSAYRAGEKLHNEYDGITHDYSRKTGIVYSEIMLTKNAPQEYAERSFLWNAVEKSERRRDAQTAREIEVALPKEFSLNEQIKLVQDYTNENFVSKGLCADISIHDKGDGNPHVHIMLTTREVKKSGFKKKNRSWNDVKLLESWREKWADISNEKFKEKGINERIDHRTLEAQNIDREPTIHVGHSAERAEQNNAIIERNKQYSPNKITENMNKLIDEYISIDKQLQETAKIQREISRMEHTAQELTKRSAEIHDQRASEYFQRVYGVSPEQAILEVQRIQLEAESLKRGLPNVKKLTENKELIKIEYQKHKLLAESRADGKDILRRVQKAPPQLDRISNADYEKIEPTLSPYQAQFLEEKQREMIRERMYSRGH